MNWHWRKSFPRCPDAENAAQEAFLRSLKNNELIRREGEIAAKEQHAADLFRERRESNGFLEMIEDIFIPEKR